MAQTKQIKNRIKSIRNIGHITKAMKTMALAAIRKIDEPLKMSRVYEDRVGRLLAKAMAIGTNKANPLLAQRDGKSLLLVLLTSDTGFCGPFNQNVVRAGMEMLGGLTPGGDALIFALGRKSISSLGYRGIPLEYSFPLWKPEVATAADLLARCTDIYLKGRADRVVFLHGKPSRGGESVSIGQETIFPISFAQNACVLRDETIVEPGKAEIFDFLLPAYLHARIYRLLLETKFGELDNRIRSMTNATDNAEKLVSELTLKYFKARQEGITQELLEIMSGAVALERD
jgi:F-type H+-transporting ATPase subunit gamma